MIKPNTGFRDTTNISEITVFKQEKDGVVLFDITKKILLPDYILWGVKITFSKEEFYKLAAMIGAEFDKDNNIDEFKVNKEED